MKSINGRADRFISESGIVDHNDDGAKKIHYLTLTLLPNQIIIFPQRIFENMNRSILNNNNNSIRHYVDNEIRYNNDENYIYTHTHTHTHTCTCTQQQRHTDTAFITVQCVLNTNHLNWQSQLGGSKQRYINHHSLDNKIP